MRIISYASLSAARFLAPLILLYLVSAQDQEVFSLWQVAFLWGTGFYIIEGGVSWLCAHTGKANVHLDWSHFTIVISLASLLWIFFFLAYFLVGQNKELGVFFYTQGLVGVARCALIARAVDFYSRGLPHRLMFSEFVTVLIALSSFAVLEKLLHYPTTVSFVIYDLVYAGMSFIFSIPYLGKLKFLSSRLRIQNNINALRQSKLFVVWSSNILASLGLFYFSVSIFPVILLSEAKNSAIIILFYSSIRQILNLFMGGINSYQDVIKQLYIDKGAITSFSFFICLAISVLAFVSFLVGYYVFQPRLEASDVAILGVITIIAALERMTGAVAVLASIGLRPVGWIATIVVWMGLLYFPVANIDPLRYWMFLVGFSFLIVVLAATFMSSRGTLSDSTP